MVSAIAVVLLVVPAATPGSVSAMARGVVAPFMVTVAVLVVLSMTMAWPSGVARWSVVDDSIGWNAPD